MSNCKMISILNMPGNSFVNFTFLNMMYSAGKYAAASGKKILFVDMDILRAEFSRSFDIKNVSVLVPIIEKYKKDWTIDKEEIMSLVVKEPSIKYSGIKMENCDGFFMTGNFAKIGEFLKFDNKFVKELLDVLKEEYDMIYIFMSPDKESKLNKYLVKISDKIVSPITNTPNVLNSTVELVEFNNINADVLIIFFNMISTEKPKPKNFIESMMTKLIPVKEVSEDEFLNKLSYYFFKRVLSDEEKAKSFIHIRINERIKEAELNKDTMFNENKYLTESEREAYLKYLVDFIKDMF